MKITDHIKNAKGKTLFSFEVVPPKKGNNIRKLSLSLIIAGSLSNIFDRFTRGYVVDYIRIKTKGADKVIFNLGDIFILLGSLIMPFGVKKKTKEILPDIVSEEE